MRTRRTLRGRAGEREFMATPRGHKINQGSAQGRSGGGGGGGCTQHPFTSRDDNIATLSPLWGAIFNAKCAIFYLRGGIVCRLHALCLPICTPYIYMEYIL